MILILVFVIVCIVVFFAYRYSRKIIKDPGSGYVYSGELRPITEDEKKVYYRWCTLNDEKDDLWVSRGKIVDYRDNLARGACINADATHREYLFCIDFIPDKTENKEEKEVRWISEREVYYRRTSRGYIGDWDTGEGIMKGTGCNIIWTQKNGEYLFRYIMPDGVKDGTRYIHNV